MFVEAVTTARGARGARRTAPDRTARETALIWASLAAENHGDVVAAAAYAQRGLDDGPTTPYLEASLLSQLAQLAMGTGDHHEAARHAETPGRCCSRCTRRTTPVRCGSTPPWRRCSRATTRRASESSTRSTRWPTPDRSGRGWSPSPHGPSWRWPAVESDEGSRLRRRPRERPGAALRGRRWPSPRGCCSRPPGAGRARAARASAGGRRTRPGAARPARRSTPPAVAITYVDLPLNGVPVAAVGAWP